MEEWSNSSRLSSSSSSSSTSCDDDDEEDDVVMISPVVVVEEDPFSVCQSAARWLSLSEEPKGGKVSGGAVVSSGAAHSGWSRWLDRGGATTTTHIVMHQVVCAGCILTSLLTLCGLDLTTCAQLLLALLALAAVFCDMH
jgi:hypothetical protein